MAYVNTPRYGEDSSLLEQIVHGPTSIQEESVTLGPYLADDLDLASPDMEYVSFQNVVQINFYHVLLWSTIYLFIVPFLTIYRFNYIYLTHF